MSTCAATRTLPLPASAYDPHEYVPNDFDECLGCGHDAQALCHVQPKVPDTLAG